MTAEERAEVTARIDKLVVELRELVEQYGDAVVALAAERRIEMGVPA